MSSHRPGRAILLPLLVFSLVVLGQWPLASNPGYFSHDELQWAAYAAEGRTFDWGATHLFQYRPLTFSTWLWLSSLLFGTPPAFHSVLVAAGAVNAALACLLALRLGARPVAAVVGAALFGLGPHAMYVHGWIGTIGDVLWVGLGLGAMLVASSRRLPVAATGVLVATCVALALLAKEAAVSIAPLMALVAWLGTAPDSAARRRWTVATVVAGVVVAAWLGWRLEALLAAPAQPGTAYSLAAGHVPLRWLEQFLFLPDPAVPEVHVVLADGWDKRAVVAALLWIGALVALSRAGWRWAVALLLGGTAALAPALPLASGANQYGYGFACVVTLVAACAWPRVPAWGRALLTLAGLLVLWHGVAVMSQVRAVGERQARFSPAVAAALEDRDTVLRLGMEDESDRWMYQRLVHDIPHYDGVRFGDRVRLAQPGEPADAIVREDGSLAPAR